MTPRSLRTIAVLTATRAEYGLLKWIMRDIADDPSLTLQIIVTGAHLSEAHGSTIGEIEGDGFTIDARVDMQLDGDSEESTIRSMAICTEGVGRALARLRPDILVVLGDRYELLPVASVATVLRIPLAHVSGGDVTEGAIDNQVRHALTKLAHLHFPGNEESAERIVQMGEDRATVVVTGEPGLDELRRTVLPDRAELARDLDLDLAREWVLFAYHPETLAAPGVDADRVEAALAALAKYPNCQMIITRPNADRGGEAIVAGIERWVAREPARFRFFASLGHRRFLAVMAQAAVVVGNSSAGIVEAASFRTPVVNIGERQKGRLLPKNVVSAAGSASSIEAALGTATSADFRAGLADMTNPYGDGRASEIIVDTLRSFPLDGMKSKSFHDHRR